MKRRTREGLVYSTEHGRMCPGCGWPVDRCACSKPESSLLTGDGVVRVSRQVQGRKGKAVTMITGIPLAAEALGVLAKELKSRCGSGGTVKGGVVEIQGDHRDRLVGELERRGWTVKKAGG